MCTCSELASSTCRPAWNAMIILRIGVFCDASGVHTIHLRARAIFSEKKLLSLALATLCAIPHHSLYLFVAKHEMSPRGARDDFFFALQMQFKDIKSVREGFPHLMWITFFQTTHNNICHFVIKKLTVTIEFHVCIFVNFMN